MNFWNKPNVRRTNLDIQQIIANDFKLLNIRLLFCADYIETKCKYQVKYEVVFYYT